MLVVLLSVIGDQFLHASKGFKLVQVKPLMFQHSPPCFDH